MSHVRPQSGWPCLLLGVVCFGASACSDGDGAQAGLEDEGGALADGGDAPTNGGPESDPTTPTEASDSEDAPADAPAIDTDATDGGRDGQDDNDPEADEDPGSDADDDAGDADTAQDGAYDGTDSGDLDRVDAPGDPDSSDPDAYDLDDTDEADVALEVTCEYAFTGVVGLPTDPDAPAFVDVSAYAPTGLIDNLDTVFGGLALVDVDLDGHLDIVYTANEGRLGLLRNCGDGTFYNDSASLPVQTLRRARLVNYADLDRDGDPDLYIGGHGRAYLFENQGDGTFRDESAAWGLGLVAGRGGASFSDFDGDGWIDLYESSYETRRNRLRRNTGASLTEITSTPGNQPFLASSLQVAWTDLNGDGRPDLSIVNDFGMLTGGNQFFLNAGADPADPNNWRFTDVSEVTGFQAAIFGMGTSFGDFDNDGDLDAYTANITRNLLHVVEQGPTCPVGAPGACVVDRAAAHGLEVGQVASPTEPPGVWPVYDPDSSDPTEAALNGFCALYCDTAATTRALVSWSPLWFDVDQNGWLDLHITNGWVYYTYMPIAEWEPNYLFLNDGGSFIEAPTSYLATTTGTSRGSAYGDLDGDGDLDLVWIDNGRIGPGALRVYENRASLGHWLRIRLVAIDSNPDAIGARLVLVAGDLTLTREVDGGQGFASASERAPHFGLGEHTTVDSLLIRWPSGRLQELVDLDVDQWVTVTESSEP